MRCIALKGIFASVALLVLSNPAFALCTSYPNTLTNGTTADGGQVMADFNCAVLQSGATIGTATLTGTTTIPGSGSISSTGAVGIGMTPSNILDITQNQNGASKISLVNSNSGSVAEMRIVLSNGTHAGLIQQAGTGWSAPFFSGGPTTAEQMNVGTQANAPLILGTNGTARAIILGNGNVGIGTASPNNMLELNGGAFDFYNPGNWVAVGLDWDATSATLRFRSNNGSSNLNQTNMAIQRVSGNVGIGTTSPSYTLHVNGSVAGTSAYVNLSDARLKKDITPISDALSIIEHLQGVRFQWRSRDERLVGKDLKLAVGAPQVGFIAQRVNTVLPEAVSIAKDHDSTMSVAESKVVPVLVEAIKELKSTNDKQAAALTSLKAANDNQAIELGKLRTQMSEIQHQIGTRTAQR